MALTELEIKRNERKMAKVDALQAQCSICKLGKKKIGPKSGCDIRKKLVVDRNETAWRLEHLFFDDKGMCKMFKPDDQYGKVSIPGIF